MDPFIKSLFSMHLEDSIGTVIAYSVASDAKWCNYLSARSLSSPAVLQLVRLVLNTLKDMSC